MQALRREDKEPAVQCCVAHKPVAIEWVMFRMRALALVGAVLFACCPIYEAAVGKGAKIAS